MDPINHVKQSIHRAGEKFFDVGSFICTDIEPLEKVAKVSYRSIEFIQLAFSLASTGFKTLARNLKDSAEIFESVHVFERYRELFFPDANGNSFFKVNSRMKIIDRILLTVHSTMKTTGYLMSVGLFTLGKVSSVAIGHLTVFKFVTESFVVGSSFFGIMDTKNKFVDARSQLKNAKSKIEKWEHRPEFLAKVQAGDQEVLAGLKSKYRTKTFSLSQQIAAVEQKAAKANEYAALMQNTDPVAMPEALSQKLEKSTSVELAAKYKEKAQALATKIADLQAKRHDYEIRVEDIESGNYDGIAANLAKSDATFKARKWEVVKTNANIMFTKAWLNIAKSVAKIVVVSFALVVIALNQWALPYALTLLGLGIISDGLGLTKILYEHYVKLQPVPTKPALNPQPVA